MVRKVRPLKRKEIGNRDIKQAEHIRIRSVPRERLGKWLNERQIRDDGCVGRVRKKMKIKGIMEREGDRVKGSGKRIDDPPPRTVLGTI